MIPGGALAVLALMAAGATAAAARKPRVNPPLPDGWRRMRQKEVTAEHTAFAIEARRQIGEIGKLQYSDVGGQRVAALTEWHYHDPDGPIRPHGWHRGITLLVEATT